jgi:hypothetical protein
MDPQRIRIIAAMKKDGAKFKEVDVCLVADICKEEIRIVLEHLRFGINLELDKY